MLQMKNIFTDCTSPTRLSNVTTWRVCLIVFPSNSSLSLSFNIFGHIYFLQFSSDRKLLPVFNRFRNSVFFTSIYTHKSINNNVMWICINLYISNSHCSENNLLNLANTSTETYQPKAFFYRSLSQHVVILKAISYGFEMPVFLSYIMGCALELQFSHMNRLYRQYTYTCRSL